MQKTVLDFLNKYNLSDKTLVIGFSGGYDSLCLLNILFELSKEQSIKLIAAHLNHNWRGEEAKQEQERCRKFCKDKNIEFYTETLSLTEKSDENTARKLRYEFFERALKKYSADVILTAHNYNDNAETLLYRIIKGTGVIGLHGILEKRENIYRPLISIERDEIEDYCKKHNLVPNNDLSNKNIKYKRNYIRQEILPKMMMINKNVISSINSLSDIAKDEEKIIDEYLKNIKEKTEEDGKILTKEYKKLSPEIKRRLIYDLLIRENIDYSSKTIYKLYDFTEENIEFGKTVKTSLTSNIWLSVDNNFISVIKKEDKISDKIQINKEGSYEIGDYVFSIEKNNEKITNFPSDDSYCAYIDLSDYDFNFILRTRLDGDIIIPYGMVGSMKFKKYLISKKIPQHKRDNLILLCKRNEVLWVAGFGLSNRIYVKDYVTHKITLTKKADL